MTRLARLLKTLIANGTIARRTKTARKGQWTTYTYQILGGLATARFTHLQPAASVVCGAYRVQLGAAI